MALFSSSKASLQAIDNLLGSVGLEHGRRQLLGAGYVPQARHSRQEAPEPQQKSAIRTNRTEPVRAAVLSDLLPAGVRHGFATRNGGVSTVYFGAEAVDHTSGDPSGDLNCGFTASDARGNVLQNRERLVKHIFGEARPLVTLRQVHSSLIHHVTRVQAGEDSILTGDGLMTDEPGIVLGIQTADCVPVLVADRRLGAIAAFHAGWKGTLQRIVERGIGTMRVEFGSRPQDLVAAIGPAIGQCCYSVGEEVEHEFRSQFAYADELFCEVYDSDPVRKKYPMLFLSQRAPGHSDLGPSLHLDLEEANRRQLLDAGVQAEAITGARKCTSCRTDLFFSHRGEHGFTGRMLSVIGRD